MKTDKWARAWKRAAKDNRRGWEDQLRCSREYYNKAEDRAQRAEQAVKVLRETLKEIARVRYGLDFLHDADEAAEYWARLCENYRGLASNTLASTADVAPEEKI